MGLINYLQSFCEKYDEYQFISDGDNTGISLSSELSYMDMMFKLTKFLEENDFDDENLELSNPDVEELDGKTVVYFPYIIAQ